MGGVSSKGSLPLSVIWYFISFSEWIAIYKQFWTYGSDMFDFVSEAAVVEEISLKTLFSSLYVSKRYFKLNIWLV